MSTVETIYQNNDNTIELILKTDDIAENLSGATRMTLTLGAVTIDSDVTGFGVGLPFDWTTDGVNGKVILKLGQQPINVGKYAEPRLAVYDAGHPNGIAWDDFGVIVK